MKLLNNNILCEKHEEEANKSGFILPNKNKNYRVLKVINGGEHLNEGDIIYTPLHSGTEVEINNKIYEIINISSIILIL